MNKSLLKKIIILIIIVILGGFIIYRLFYYDKPGKDVNEAFSAISKGNGSEAAKYMDYDSFYQYIGDESVYKLIMKSMSYSVKSVNQNDTTAIAVVEVSNRNIEELYNNFVVEAYQLVLSEAYLTEEEKAGEELLSDVINEMYIDALSDEEADKVTNELTISMTREGRVWKLAMTDLEYDAITGGFITAKKNADKVLGDMTSQSLVKIEEAYQKNINDAQHILRNSAHFIVEDLWNGNLCDIVSCINAGTAANGSEYDLKAGLKALDDLMTEKLTYDVYMNNLSDQDYGNIKSAWKDVSDALSKLTGEIKEADPKPTDYYYTADTSDFEKAMQRYVDLIYNRSELQSETQEEK